ncbi:MAG TPA: hypothetical protein VF611_11600 [Pyrinomonadaceae bacterium]
MNQRLKVILAVGALQLFAASPAAAGRAERGVRFDGTPRVAAGARAAAGRGASMTQTGGARGRRKRAGDALLPGVWGGERIRFEVTARGAAVEYDCAHGTVEGRIVVDRSGRFSVAGTHYEEHGGPVRAGEDAGGYPVRLSGQVGGSLLKLTVRRADTKELIGTFTLSRDREAELVKCR